MRDTRALRRVFVALLTTMLVTGAVACVPFFDLDGDLKADRVWVNSTTGEWFSSGTPTALFTQPLAKPSTGSYPEPVAADYDGNQYLDAAYVVGNTWTYRNTVGVADASQGRPTTSTDHVITMPKPPSNGASDTLIPVPADYDGNGAAEPAWYRVSDATWFVKDRPPVQFGLGRAAADGWQDIPVPADYDGDSDADLATYRPGDATWRVQGRPDVVQLGTMGNYPVPGDWTGDRAAEMAVYGFDRTVPGSASRRWLIAGESAPRPAPVAAGQVPVPADYSGDGHLHPGYFDYSTGVWSYGDDLTATALHLRTNFTDRPTLIPSSNLFSFFQLAGLDNSAAGRAAGNPTPAGCPAGPEPQTCSTLTPTTRCEDHPWDFTGDGKADRVWVDRPTGDWYIEGVEAPIAQGAPFDDVMYAPGDYDGDGAWELAYVGGDGSQWITSGAAGTITFPKPAPSVPGSDDHPPLAVPADYDGNGTTDPAWYRQSDAMWFIPGRDPIQFGVGYVAAPGWEHIPVPADYDGDGDDDIATYSPGDGKFHILGVADPIDVGEMGNFPAPADYDGDGEVDPATLGFDRSAGIGYARWTIHLSSTNTTTTTIQDSPPSVFLPTPADYDGDGRADLSAVSDDDGVAPYGEWWVAGKASIHLAGAAYASLPANGFPVPIWSVIPLTFLDLCAISLIDGDPDSSSCPAGPMPT